MFNSGFLLRVIPSPRNKKPKTSHTFKSSSGSFPSSDHEIHTKYSCMQAFCLQIGNILTHSLANSIPSWTEDFDIDKNKDPHKWQDR